MKMEFVNLTTPMELAENLSAIAECLELLRMTTVSPLASEDDVRNLTSENSMLSYCVNHIREYPATQPYVLPLWQQILWVIVFSAMVTVAVLGNSIVIWIVLAHRRMRTVTNFFLVNLSTADLMMATFNTIFNFVFMLNSDWPFGRTYCTFSNFVATLTVSSSVFTITAVSVDRYIGIVRPLRPRMSKKLTVALIAIIWLCGSLLSLPNLIYSDTKTYTYPDGTPRVLCFIAWPQGTTLSEDLDYVYNIVILLTTYVVPLSSLIVTYSWMGHVLWKSKGIGEVTQTQESAVKSKHKVARMLTIVAVIFAICWLPYHIYFLYVYHNADITETYYVQHMYLAFYWLAMSNTMYNPIVYCWMNSRFRNYFRGVLCCCCKAMNSNGISQPVSFRSAMKSLGTSAISTEGSYRKQGGIAEINSCTKRSSSNIPKAEYRSGKQQELTPSYV